jgi:uncharacterized membrane protein
MDLKTIAALIFEFRTDFACFVLSLIVVLAYYVLHARKVRADPSYSIHYVNSVARKAWIEYVMTSPGKDIMAVQTLRNYIMNSILMVTTTSLLIVGTLTLSGQSESISRSWHAINLGGSHSAELWIFKIMCLLADFLVAFFSYALSIRLANHVLFMLNVPKEIYSSQAALSPEAVAARLNRSGQMIAIGMRAYFYAIPLVFWLFGPMYMLLATIGIVAILSRLDRQRDGI